MKMLYRALAILAVPAILVLFSYANGSPGGKSGSIGDGGDDCTGCHAGSPQGVTGWITTNIPDEGFTPGQTYVITATGMHDGVVKFGFEMTSEDNVGGKVGSYVITDPARTKLTNSNTAITHTAAGNVPTGNVNTWSVDWVAPEVDDGVVWFYAAFNAANGNGNTAGDQIYTTSLSTSEYVPVPVIATVDPDHAEQGWSGTLALTGENTTWTDGVFAVVFEYAENDSVKFLATNIQVESDTELTCDISLDEDQAVGPYNVSVGIANIPSGFTVDVASSIGDQMLADEVRAYPNPATDYLSIEVPEGSQISLIDMNGRVVMTELSDGGADRLDLTSYDPGIFFLRIEHETHTATKKIIKQ